MSFARGSPLPIHDVNCLICGVALQRKTYWRNPKCSPCTRKLLKEKECGKVKRLRQEARRYRILLHVLGWPDTNEGFAEMLAEIKASPMAFRRGPESRGARYDLALERRTRRYTGRSQRTSAIDNGGIGCE